MDALSKPLEGAPAVLARGQGSLLDVELDPRFAEYRLVYLSYAEPEDNGTAGTAVARGRLVGNRLEDMDRHHSIQTQRGCCVGGPRGPGNSFIRRHGDNACLRTEG